jgi:transcriptional regulator with XRE-family HTH domain
MGFKENLRDEISYQGLMIKEVAGKAGLTPGTMSNYLKENSSIPSADIAVKIAKALNVAVEYLVSGKEITPSATQQIYSSEVRKYADKMMNMSKEELFLVESLIDAIIKIKK